MNDEEWHVFGVLNRVPCLRIINSPFFFFKCLSLTYVLSVSVCVLLCLVLVDCCSLLTCLHMAPTTQTHPYPSPRFSLLFSLSFLSLYLLSSSFFLLLPSSFLLFFFSLPLPPSLLTTTTTPPSPVLTRYTYYRTLLSLRLTAHSLACSPLHNTPISKK